MQGEIVAWPMTGPGGVLAHNFWLADTQKKIEFTVVSPAVTSLCVGSTERPEAAVARFLSDLHFC